jgi:hypothetical protein
MIGEAVVATAEERPPAPEGRTLARSACELFTERNQGPVVDQRRHPTRASVSDREDHRCPFDLDVRVVIDQEAALTPGGRPEKLTNERGWLAQTQRPEATVDSDGFQLSRRWEIR